MFIFVQQRLDKNFVAFTIVVVEIHRSVVINIKDCILNEENVAIKINDVLKLITIEVCFKITQQNDFLLFINNNLKILN